MNLLKDKVDVERAEFEKKLTPYAPAKREVLRFIRYAKENEIYTIEFPGNLFNAEKYVNNMRTVLSRYRTQAAKAKVHLKQFKIQTVEITFNEKTDKSSIQLMMVREGRQKVSEDMEMFLAEVMLVK